MEGIEHCFICIPITIFPVGKKMTGHEQDGQPYRFRHIITEGITAKVLAGGFGSGKQCS